MSGEITLPESAHPKPNLRRKSNILLASIAALSITGCNPLDRFDSNKTCWDYTGIYSGVTTYLFFGDSYNRFYDTATACLPKADDPNKYTCPSMGEVMRGKVLLRGYLEPGTCEITRN